MVILLTFSFASIWCAGKAASKLGLPTLVGEIMVGVVLGPPLANLMPVPEALMLFGEVGLVLLVLEAVLNAVAWASVALPMAIDENSRPSSSSGSCAL